MPNGDDKNWMRVCMAVDGFRGRYGRWPKRVRIMPVSYIDLVSHVLSPIGHAIVSSFIELVPEDDAEMIAEDDTGAAHCYGRDGDGGAEVEPKTYAFFGDAVLRHDLGDDFSSCSFWDADGNPLNENAIKQGPLNSDPVGTSERIAADLEAKLKFGNVVKIEHLASGSRDQSGEYLGAQAESYSESTKVANEIVNDSKVKKNRVTPTVKKTCLAPIFWKLSMAGDDFKTILDVIDWTRRGVVLVHKKTRPKGTSQTSQGDHFIESERFGDYFYLCHGNHEPSILLLGQFTGPLNIFCERGNGWTERPFRWIKTSVSTKSFAGQPKWWAPNHNSTFVRVPENELPEFEADILRPYFGIELKDFGVHETA